MESMIIGIEHVAIATDDAGTMRELFEMFGLKIVYEEDLAEDAVHSEQFGTPNANIEVLTALEPSATVARFVKKNGPGLHHICFRVDDLDATIAQVQAAGLELVRPQPTDDTQGRRVFLHPRSGRGVLMGLVERKGAV